MKIEECLDIICEDIDNTFANSELELKDGQKIILEITNKEYIIKKIGFKD